MQMKTALYVGGKVIGTVLKFALIVALIAGHLIADFIGLLVCAITEG